MSSTAHDHYHVAALCEPCASSEKAVEAKMEEEARREALRRSQVNHSQRISGRLCLCAACVTNVSTLAVAVVAESSSAAYSKAVSFPALFG